MWNKTAAFMTVIVAASLLLAPCESEARGGRGSARGNSGGRNVGSARSGSNRSGQTINRTPTMSRASNRPTPSRARQQVNTRPSVSSNRVQQPRQSSRRNPSSTNHAELRNQVNDFAKNRQTLDKPSQSIDHQALSQKAQQFSNTHNSQLSQNRQLSNTLSQRLQQAQPSSSQWFNQSFFDRQNVGTDYARARANWWRPAAWGTLAAWGAWGWSTPYYYDDNGYAYPITTYESTETYPAADSNYAYPSNTATKSTQTLSTQNMQATASSEEEWLPLGVYALASSPDTAAQTNRFIQLAVNRKGEIAGVFYNSQTDIAQDITGIVDQENQKAYWTLENRIDAPVASTGIYNLTEDQTPINVHFPDGSEQIWTLVRLHQT